MPVLTSPPPPPRTGDAEPRNQQFHVLWGKSDPVTTVTPLLTHKSECQYLASRKLTIHTTLSVVHLSLQ
jgi:hypothetical protein